MGLASYETGIFPWTKGVGFSGPLSVSGTPPKMVVLTCPPRIGRKTLSSVLGVDPSAETRAVAASLGRPPG